MGVEPRSRDLSADPDDLARLYVAMLRIRLFEDAVLRLFLANEVEGTTHLCQGQEAVAVGVCAALEPGDTVAATYRGHGAALALGVDATALMAELLGRETGTNGGRGGSMNVTDLERGLIGCFGIVGGSIAAATGAALAAQLTRDGSVAVAFFGDGAVNQAYFHECLNFAAVRRLPVVYVCENNLYGEWTPMASVTAGADIAARGAAYALPAQAVDGNDVLAVREAASAALARARNGEGPTLLEFLTYRHKGHSKVDPGAYRPPEEVEEWLGRDPLLRLAAQLGDDAVEQAHEDAEGELERLLDAARAAAFPTPGAPATATKGAAA
ncbi:MAG TPA: thiamine pyrophosphate-dependent dehydrogenase E1 component subunit alpha [Gaiellaceae bacterium]|nr:thiamine pyrophosphate-dependent dehydrogenase E1 component subunit alpha [Gaiellaceae bacterium]